MPDASADAAASAKQRRVIITMYLQQHWTTGKHSWTGRRCIGVATISAAERNRMSAGALRSRRGRIGSPPRLHCLRIEGDEGARQRGGGGDREPLPDATFSPSHICAMPRCGPEGHTVLMSGSLARADETIE